MTCDDCGPMAADLKRAVDAWNYFEADARQAWQQVNDLKHHLRDRDAHIKNLEAELRPHLVAQQQETEPML